MIFLKMVLSLSLSLSFSLSLLLFLSIGVKFSDNLYLYDWLQLCIAFNLPLFTINFGGGPPLQDLVASLCMRDSNLCI